MAVRKFYKRVLTAAVIAAASGGVIVSAQVRQLQLNNRMDANPAVGSGGTNTPVTGFVPINGNEIISGNVSGLASFHGRTSVSSAYEFQGRLGSASLFNFSRQSAPSPYSNSVASVSSSYYLPSSTVSTAQGTLYSAPIGSGFDSQIVPRSAIRPTVTAQQVNGLVEAMSPSGGAINRVPEMAAPIPGTPGAVIDSPLFVLRDTTPAAGPATQPRIDSVVPTPSDSTNQSDAATKPSPQMVQGAINAGRDARVTGQTDEIKSAAALNESIDGRTSDVFAKLAEDLKKAQSGESVAGTGSGMATGNTTDKNTRTNDIDPLTGRQRLASADVRGGKTFGDQPTLPGKPGTPTSAKKTTSAVSSKPLDNLSTNQLTAGNRVNPVKMTKAIETGSQATAFDLLMLRGERFMKDGKFIDAQIAYQSALLQKPEDPLALIAMSHAELASGAYAPAAYDLKFLFARKPEMVAVRYDVNSFIPASRQEYLLDDLQKQTSDKTTADTASFLYCYLCYQGGHTALLKSELSKWAARPEHDSWQAIVARAWGTPPKEQN